MGVSDQSGSVYNETVYRPKDQMMRSQKRRKMILIGIVALLLIILLIIIIAVAVSKSKSPKQALIFYPKAKDDIIRFTQGKLETTDKYIKDLHQLLEDYKKKNDEYGAKLYNCTDGNAPPPNTDSACQFDTMEMEAKAAKDFGYYEGQPIVILQLQPPKDWTPQLYKNNSEDSYWKNVDESIRSPDHVPVSCKGKYYEDGENIGVVQMFPAHGFPAKYFPYRGQSVYIAPLVLVQFRTPVIGVLITVQCQVLDPSITNENSSPFQATFYLEVN